MPTLETVQALLAEVDALIRQNRKAQIELQEQYTKLSHERAGLQLTVERLGGAEVGNDKSAPETPKAPPNADSRQTRHVELQPQQPLTPILTPMPTPVADSWVQMNRTEAVEAAMREIRHPTDRKEIGRVLWSHGRDDDVNDISAALSYLQRKTAAKKRSDDGRWALLAGAAVGALAVGTALLAAETTKENAAG
jgi:hypothetical protein